MTLDQIKELTFSKIESPVNSGVIVSKSGSVGEIRLYSPIGSALPNGIDGAKVAEEITFLSSFCDTVVIRINTFGGSVLEGMAIMAAMQTSKTKTICIIDGIAASIGAVMAICAHETHIVDYGLMMVHTTSMMDGSDGGDITKKFDDSLSLVYQKRLNKSEDEVSKFFKKGKDTWFSADEALAAGLVNSVIPTVARDLVNTAKQLIAGTVTDVALYEVANLFNNQLNNKPKMNKEILNALGLTEAGETDVINAIAAMKSQLTAKDVTIEANRVELENKAAEIAELTNKVAAFEAEKAAKHEQEIKEVIDAAIKAKKIANNARERWTNLAKLDLASVKDALNELQPAAKLSDLLKDDKADEVKDFKPLTVANLMKEIETKTKEA